MMQRRQGVKHIADLPDLPGEGPWESVIVRDDVFFFSPNHPPLVFRDGRLTPVSFSDATNDDPTR